MLNFEKVLRDGVELTSDDINQLVLLLGNRCRESTKRRLRSMLTYGRDAIEKCGILSRLYRENDTWHYCAGQSYPDEIRTLRQVILGKG